MQGKNKTSRGGREVGSYIPYFLKKFPTLSFLVNFDFDGGEVGGGDVGVVSMETGRVAVMEGLAEATGV